MAVFQCEEKHAEASVPQGGPLWDDQDVQRSLPACGASHEPEMPLLLQRRTAAALGLEATRYEMGSHTAAIPLINVCWRTTLLLRCEF